MAVNHLLSSKFLLIPPIPPLPSNKMVTLVLPIYFISKDFDYNRNRMRVNLRSLSRQTNCHVWIVESLK